VCKRILLVVVLVAALGFPLAAGAQEKLTVAVAANFINPFKEIAELFKEKTQIVVEGTFSSSGNLTSQIKEGAPYDVFLSADEERPNILFRDGLAEKPLTYARGQVILWTARKDLCQEKSWQQVVQMDAVRKIAIANPTTAPYGAAAQAALQKVGLWEKIEKNLVFAQNIAQAFQYCFTENTDVGFCALSEALSEQGKKGCFFEIAEAPIIFQAACVLKKSSRQKAAGQFVAFLNSLEAEAVKKKYGYR